MTKAKAKSVPVQPTPFLRWCHHCQSHFVTPESGTVLICHFCLYSDNVAGYTLDLVRDVATSLDNLSEEVEDGIFLTANRLKQELLPVLLELVVRLDLADHQSLGQLLYCQYCDHPLLNPVRPVCDWCFGEEDIAPLNLVSFIQDLKLKLDKLDLAEPDFSPDLRETINFVCQVAAGAGAKLSPVPGADSASGPPAQSSGQSVPVDKPRSARKPPRRGGWPAKKRVK